MEGRLYHWARKLHLNPDKKSTEQLFATMLMTCCAFGTLLIGLKSKAFTALRDLTLGLAAGLLVYLLMRGGKMLFVIGPAADVSTTNPYTAATVAVLVGLFTEKAFNALTAAVNTATTRWLKQAEQAPSNGTDSNSTREPPREPGK